MSRHRTVRLGSAAALLLLSACSSSSDSSPSAAPSHSGSTTTSNQPAPTAPPRQRPGTVASVGCARPPAAEVSLQQGSVKLAGASRNYLLTTPSPHSTPDPLVVDFHGYGEGDRTEALTTQFGALGQHAGFLVVFPNGTGSPIAWNTSTKPGNPDVRFVGRLLDSLETSQCIDEARVYATGLSQGAFMTSTVACVLSARFAAVAPVAGVQRQSTCPITRHVPLLAFHGTADPILHFNGGIGRKVLRDDLRARPKPLPTLPKPKLNGPGYPANVASWAALDGCRTTPTDTRPSPAVIHRTYPCLADTAVQFDIIVGGGHSWPGSALSKEIRLFVGPTTSEINATTTIWAFFERFHLDHVGG
jgi:polyhydroxybutyrate depolymerase